MREDKRIELPPGRVCTTEQGTESTEAFLFEIGIGSELSETPPKKVDTKPQSHRGTKTLGWRYAIREPIASPHFSPDFVARDVSAAAAIAYRQG